MTRISLPYLRDCTPRGYTTPLGEAPPSAGLRTTGFCQGQVGKHQGLSSDLHKNGSSHPQQLDTRALQGKVGVWESGGPKEAMASATGARESFKSPRDKSRPGPFSGFQDIDYKLALAKNSCQELNNNMGICHVPPQRLNPVRCSC